tara:strand:- start:22 stop:738 length:717 start_codon:yes stop_codon:yes gene_type:complete
MKVLVLGHSGMLGNTVCDYLRGLDDISIVTTRYRWPTDSFKTSIKNFDGDYIINCIGAIPQRTNKFEINYELPIWLDKNVTCRVIHQDTDMKREEDDYAFSKAEASMFISFDGKRTKMLKTSILGHDKNKVCLLDWFLNSEGEVFGYTDSYSNGNTTLEWAKQVYNMMNNWEQYAKCTSMSTKCISKYELLNLFKEVYDKDIIINKKTSAKKDRCLLGQLRVPTLREQLNELKEFYDY